MKKIVLCVLLISGYLNSQTPCVNGFAGIFPCSKIDLMKHMPFSQIGGNATTDGSGCWGWTDPVTNKEYAIMGCSTHTAFVDITNPSVPVYKGKVLAHNNTTSIWREISVINNHALIVSEATGHGLQIFDLTRLRNVTTPQTFTADARYTGFGSCHSISSNPATGFVYCDGSQTYNGGPHILNFQNPTSPTLAGGYAEEGYTHDAQIVIYNGPDPDHQGKELFMGANATKVSVVDVTNKSNPVTISNFEYDNLGYTHQGWFTPDQKYWILCDETDETQFGFNGRSIIIDMTDLDNPVLKGEYYGTTPAIDHNAYIKGNEMYLASYTAGLRILNTSSIASTGTLNEIAYFDTYPENNNALYNGVWNTYAFFPSGNVIMSDIDRGLFVVRKNASLATEKFLTANYTMSPNPASTFFKINSEEKIEKISLYDALGKMIKKYESQDQYDISDIAKGLYFVKVNDTFSNKLIIE